MTKTNRKFKKFIEWKFDDWKVTFIIIFFTIFVLFGVWLTDFISKIVFSIFFIIIMFMVIKPERKVYYKEV